MTKYEFRAGYRARIKPEVAARELEKVRKREGGKLKPEAVVETARPEQAPLHPAFTWDDSEAAEEYRRWEARQLIRSVVVTHEGGEPEPRYVNVALQDRYYQSTEVIVTRPDEYQAAVAELARKIRMAEHALDALRNIAERSADPDRLARLALAAQAFAAARAAVEHIQ